MAERDPYMVPSRAQWEAANAEIQRLRAQVTRLQADSTAELLKHRSRAELLDKVQAQNIELLDKLSAMTDKYCAALDRKGVSRG